MLHELIMFGGIAFWVITSLVVLLLFCSVESSDEAYSVYFPISVGLFYLFSKPPVIDTYLIITYLVIGLVWFLGVFRYKLSIVKKYLKDYPEYIKDGLVNLSAYSPNVKDYQRHSIVSEIYLEEPSFPRFFDRFFCWPISMIKMFFGDFMQFVYYSISDGLKNYKNNFLTGGKK